MKDECCVFPDTNVFLHFPPMKDINWCTIADAKAVHLVICMTVIHELDAKKSDSRLSARAERAIKEIRDSQKEGLEIRSGVTLSVFNREVRASDFPETLSPESADDQIVHLVKLYLSEHPENQIAIATGDYGMELRASAGGIEIIALEPTHRLANPQDELTKKYRQAVSELNAIKNRLPKLSLGLALPDDSMTEAHKVTFELKDDWKPLDIDAEMEKIKRKHPKQSDPQSQAGQLLGVGNLMSELVSPKDLQRHDAKLDEFYNDYRKHLESINVIRDAKSRSFWFDLWLQNQGTGLATDIDVFLQFPEVIRFVAEQGSKDAEPLEEELKPPEPPHRPSPLGLGAEGLRPYDDILSNMPDVSKYSFARRDEWTPDATIHQSEDHTYEVCVQVGKLKHGHNVCLGQFVAIFGSWDDVGAFNAECSISTSELAEKVTMRLPFIAIVKRRHFG